MRPEVSISSDSASSKHAALGRYWKKILSSVPDSVTVYDTEGNVLYANQLASENLRYASVEQLMSQNLSDIAGRYQLFDSAGRKLNLEELPTRRALAENTVIEETIHCVPPGGEDFWLVARAIPIYDKRHTARYVVSTYHDITHFKVSEAQLRAANERMLKLLDDLLALDRDT